MERCRTDHSLDAAWKGSRRWFDAFARLPEHVAILTLPDIGTKRLQRGLRRVEGVATDYTTGTFWVSPEVVDVDCVGIGPSLEQLFLGNVAIVSIHYTTLVGSTPLSASACVRGETAGERFRVEVFVTYAGIAGGTAPPRERFEALWRHARLLGDAFARDHVLVRVMDGPRGKPRTVARF